MASSSPVWKNAKAWLLSVLLNSQSNVTFYLKNSKEGKSVIYGYSAFQCGLVRVLSFRNEKFLSENTLHS